MADGVRKSSTWQPDLVVHPEFDENLRAAFQRETQLFLESQLGDDRSINDLIRANYTFVNERLARHYGIPDVYGERFRRVSFTDGVRGGLLGQGGLLMVTSYPDRTAPVLRGFWCSKACWACRLPAAAGRAGSSPTRSRGGSDRFASRWRFIGRIPRVQPATFEWIRWGSPWRTSTPSAGGGRRTAACGWMRQRPSLMARRSTAFVACEPSS